MRNKTFPGIIVPLVATLICICSSISVMAKTTYDSAAALTFAENNWNSKKGKCAEFVSDCLDAGGIDCWSRSSSNLREQLINSDLGTEVIVPYSGGKICVSDYRDSVKPGSVVFFHCKDCTSLPFIHTVLISSISDDGLLYCYSHNSANNASKPYQYSDTCWYCHGKVDSVYIYTFDEFHDPIGYIDNLGSDHKGQLIVEGWCFDYDKENANLKVQIQMLDVESNEIVKNFKVMADSSRPDIDEAYHTGKNHGISEYIDISPELYGTYIVNVYAMNYSGTNGESVLLASKKVNINQAYANPSLNRVILSAGETVDLSIDFNCAQYGATTIWPDISNDSVAEISYGECRIDSLTVHIKALEPGESELKYKFTDGNGNLIAETKITVVVFPAKSSRWRRYGS